MQAKVATLAPRRGFDHLNGSDKWLGNYWPFFRASCDFIIPDIQCDVLGKTVTDVVTKLKKPDTSEMSGFCIYSE